MTKEELKIKLTELLPTATFDEGGDPMAMSVKHDSTCRRLFECR